MLLRRTLLLLATSLAAPLGIAQSALPAPVPTAAADTCSGISQAAFDVATIKPSDRPSGGFSVSGGPDTVTVDASAFRMILYAYKLHDFQVTGGPGWLTTATWEATAKVDQPPTGYNSLSNYAGDDIQRQRVQAVLAQRFALRCHFETKELPVYDLVLAKGGSKLTPTHADAKDIGSLDLHGGNRASRINGTGISPELIAAILSQKIGRMVIDKTGLASLYDFTLTYTSDPDSSLAPADDSASGPTIFTALEEQLGLRLKSAKGPVPVLVVDSITHPSEN
jgi:uncharacterized protein (TIGR03435 family)